VQIETKLALRVQRPLLVALLWHCEAEGSLQAMCDLNRWHLHRALPGAPEKNSGVGVSTEMVVAADEFVQRVLHVCPHLLSGRRCVNACVILKTLQQLYLPLS
jgi:hypothetical protein